MIPWMRMLLNTIVCDDAREKGKRLVKSAKKRNGQNEHALQAFGRESYPTRLLECVWLIVARRDVSHVSNVFKEIRGGEEEGEREGGRKGEDAGPMTSATLPAPLWLLTSPPALELSALNLNLSGWRVGVGIFSLSVGGGLRLIAPSTLPKLRFLDVRGRSFRPTHPAEPMPFLSHSRKLEGDCQRNLASKQEMH